MKTMIFCLLTLVTLSTTIFAVEKSYSARHLYKACNHARIDDTESAYDLGFCDATFESLAAYFQGAVFCPPDDTTIGTLVKVFMRYVEVHPEYLDRYQLKVSQEALKETWPCSQH